MKRIILLFLFQLGIAFLSFGQNPKFFMDSRVSRDTQSLPVHTLWEGVKNPLIITSSDTTLDYSIYANGGKIVNQLKNHAFDLIPNQKDVILYVISPYGDTLDITRLKCKKLLPPLIELTLGEIQLKDGDRIGRRHIGKLKLHLLSNPQLKEDLIDLPQYDIGKIEVTHIRDKIGIAEFSSISSLNSITSSAKKGDQILIFISSYTFKDENNKPIENKFTRIYRLHIR